MNAISTTFRSGEPSLQGLMEDIRKGDKQLPDFQRGWIWDDNHIRSIIASISMSYPIGAVLLMETGGEGLRFKPRPVEGVVLANEVEPRMLILDGQQRLTSLYLALCSEEPVKTRTDKGKEIYRFYYFDISKCINSSEDRYDAIISVSPERKIKSDFGRIIDLDISKPELEYKEGLFPLYIIFNQEKYSLWRREYQRLFRQDDKKLEMFDNFEFQVIRRFQQYRVPTIELLRETPKEAVCQVFEKVNTGGVSLTVFELVTATFASDNYNLRDDWQEREKQISEFKPLQDIDSTDFLTLIALFSSYRRHKEKGSPVSCKRKDVLDLSLDEYKRYSNIAEDGLIKAARLLIGEKIFHSKDIPYKTQLIPLGAICADLGNQFENDTVRSKILRWYWCGVFGELYGGANETRYVSDIIDVLSWIKENGDEPRTIRSANFTPVRLLSLQTRLSAAYKGLIVRLMKKGSCDFLSGDPIELTNYFDQSVDIHHIFPKAYCERNNYPRSHWNCIINKVAITSRTNRIIGGKAPSSYLNIIEKDYNVSRGRLDKILESHLIVPSLLRSDDFYEFLSSRAVSILNLISGAMGKQITGRDSEETINAFGRALKE